MAKVLIIADHDGTALNPATAKAIACAAEIDGAEIDVAVFADSASGARAESAAGGRREKFDLNPHKRKKSHRLKIRRRPQKTQAFSPEEASGNTK